MDQIRTIDDYMALSYPIVLIPDQDGVWFAKIPALPGCMTESDSPSGALEMLDDARRGWIESALKHGDPIPEPDAASIEIVMQ